MTDPAKASDHVREDIQKAQTVVIIEKDRLPSITSCSEVIDGIFKFQSKWSGHIVSTPTSGSDVKKQALNIPLEFSSGP